jgi:signal transduction histidine kinase
MNTYLGGMFDHAVSWDADSGVCTITVWGPLQQGYPTRLNGLVRKCLTERPRAVLLDLHGVTSTDGLLPTVLMVLNRSVARDGARLVVSAGPNVMSILSSAARRTLSLYGTRDEAKRAAVLALPPTMMWWSLRAGAKAGEYTSTAISEACLAWNIPDARDKLSLIASELVSNALEHAGEPVEVSLSFQRGYVHLRVRDSSGHHPATQPDEDAVGRGRGLRIVEENATTWGVIDRIDGKVVWAILQVVPHARR